MATAKIAIRTDTAANWTRADPVLETGEQGYETDTGRSKIGDGTTAWTSLAYIPYVTETATQTLTNKTLTSPIIGTGAYFGGTAAANLLDDYEEGTWTVQCKDARTGGNTSSTTTIGYYRIIGGQCTVMFDLAAIDTTGLTAGNAVYFSLPLPASNTGNSEGCVRLVSISQTGTYATTETNNTSADIYVNYIQNNAATVGMKVSDISSGSGRVVITHTYFV